MSRLLIGWIPILNQIVLDLLANLVLFTEFLPGSSEVGPCFTGAPSEVLPGVSSVKFLC